MHSNLATPVDMARTEKLEAWQTWPKKPEDVMAQPRPLIGFWKIAFGILAGNLMTAIVVGVAYAIVTAR